MVVVMVHLLARPSDAGVADQPGTFRTQGWRLARGPEIVVQALGVSGIGVQIIPDLAGGQRGTITEPG